MCITQHEKSEIMQTADDIYMYYVLLYVVYVSGVPSWKHTPTTQQQGKPSSKTMLHAAVVQHLSIYLSAVPTNAPVLLYRVVTSPLGSPFHPKIPYYLQYTNPLEKPCTKGPLWYRMCTKDTSAMYGQPHGNFKEFSRNDNV